MGETSGRATGVGIAFETTYGSAVAAALWLRLEAWSCAPSAPQLSIQALHLGRAQFGRSAVNIQKDVSGSFTVRGHYDGGGLTSLLRWAVGGSWSTSGGGPYKHDLSPGAVLPSLTLRPIFGDGVGGATETGAVITGAKCNSLTITLTTDGLMDAAADFVAQSYTPGSAETPTYGTDNAILPQQAGTVAWNSGTYSPTGITIQIENGIATVRKLGSTDITAAYQVNERTASLVMSHLREDDTFITAHNALTESDAVQIITNGTDIFKATLYTARVSEAVGVSIGDTGFVEESVTFRGRDDGTNDTLLFEITNGDTNAEDS